MPLHSRVPDSTALDSNAGRLIVTTVIGEVSSPSIPSSMYRITHDGQAVILPAVGGITLNVRVGDSAFGWVADHIEPAVSARHPDEATNRAFTVLSCIGNEAVVLTGDAKGERGVVTGKHGGVDHVLIDFNPDAMEKMSLGDKIRIRAVGLGLALEGAGDLRLFNLSPRLLDAWNPRLEGGRLKVRVACIAPAAVMGSGLGRDTVVRGDYDIQAFDDAISAEYGLRDLRLGDIVAIRDADNSYGRVYRGGSMSIGVVSHGASHLAGHGPGVTTLATSRAGTIDVEIDPAANLATILGLR